MNILIQAYNEDKSTTVLNLSNQNLNSINEFQEVLFEFPNLDTLDLSNNPFDNFEETIMILSELKNLKSLKISIEKPEEALFVLQNLPFLEFLNDKRTKQKQQPQSNLKVNSYDVEEIDIEQISLDNELENFHKLFSTIQSRLEEERPDLKKQFSDQFQQILNKEIEIINEYLDTSVPNFVYGFKILMSKLKVYNFFNEVIVKIDSKKSIKAITMNLIELKNKATFEAEELNKKILVNYQLSSKGKDEVNEKIYSQEQQIKEYEKLIVSLKNENSRLAYEFDQSKEAQELLRVNMSRVEEENKRMTENILAYSKIVSNNTQPQHQSSGVITNFNKTPTQNPNFSSQRPQSVSVSNTGAKILTKKMLVEIIDEIYVSKNNFDKVSFDNKMPRETMEQYMYTFLNYKYGLKNLIIEWAVSIINAIKTFSTEDSKILLFGKILKNEIEEDFRFTYERLKKTINDLLQHYIKAKFPMKKSEDLIELIDSKIKNNGFLNEEEWKGIVYYLYEENDAKLIEAKIIEENSNACSKGQKQIRQGPISVSYFTFLKIILDFQIKCRVNFLRKFTILFKSMDSDNNGILSENEFVNMISTISSNQNINLEGYIEKLLNLTDPFNNKQINYSDCISVFSKEGIAMNDGSKETLLNIIVSDN